MSVISVRVEKKTKQTLKKAGINVSKEVKRYVEDLAWKVDLKDRLEKLNEVLEKMPPAQRGFGAKSVREDRESS